MKILIINNGPLPLPCVKGGGVESLIQMFIENTTMQDITIISVYDAEAEEISRSKNITFEYVNFNRKKDLLLRGFYYFLNKIALRPIGNAYIHKVVKKVNVSNYDLIISENGVVALVIT